MQIGKQWTGARLARSTPLIRWLATDLALDGIERADPIKGFLGDRRLRRLVQIKELASGVRLMPRARDKAHCTESRFIRGVLRPVTAGKPGATKVHDYR